MLKSIVTIAASLFALSAFAIELSDVQKIIPLKDGSAVYVFKDGKMGMEDRWGNAVRMQPGQTMEAQDGQPIAIVGDEVARVHAVLRSQWRGGK